MRHWKLPVLASVALLAGCGKEPTDRQAYGAVVYADTTMTTAVGFAEYDSKQECDTALRLLEVGARGKCYPIRQAAQMRPANS